MRWLTITVALAAFVLVGAGCGGDEESTGGTDTVVITDTSATDETTTEETTTDEATTDETETDISGVFGSEECLQLIQASADLGAAFAGTGTDADTEFFDRLADSAPEEIRADFEVLARVYRDYVEAVADIGLQPGEAPSAEQSVQLSQALASLDQTGVTEANTRISAWADENCTGG